MSKTKELEQILTSYWSVNQPIIGLTSSCAKFQPTQVQIEGMSKVEQMLASYWSEKQPIIGTQV
jgi:hypothetical protein